MHCRKAQALSSTLSAGNNGVSGGLHRYQTLDEQRLLDFQAVNEGLRKLILPEIDGDMELELEDWQ